MLTFINIIACGLSSIVFQIFILVERWEKNTTKRVSTFKEHLTAKGLVLLKLKSY